jgi:hypothetical protein
MVTPERLKHHDEGVTMRPTPRPARAAVTALAAFGLALALAACGAADDSGAATSEGGNPGQSLQGRDDRAPEKPGAPADAAKPPAERSAVDAAAAVAQRKLTRRADVALDVENLASAATQVRSIASTAGGLVVAEEISSGPTPRVRDQRGEPGIATITISVPTTTLDATLDRLGQVGVVLSRNSSTEDVTARYVDTESRLRSMKASVERVRALMAQATKLGEIVSLEAELSRRQADLESLQTQLAALDDAVALSPITVSMSTDADAVPGDDTGFLAGLNAGWGAFTASVTIALTALGAVLPFAVLVALVLGPFLVWLRRRSGGRAAPATPVGPAPAAGPPAA